MVAKVKVTAINLKDTQSRWRFPVRALSSPRSKRRSAEIVPLGPLAPSRRGVDSDASFLSSLPRIFPLRREGSESRPALSFREAFGVLGLPMLLMLLGCTSWTLWLILLNLAPNAAANFVMNTSELDNGQFWLIPDEWGLLQVCSTAGLTLVLATYLYVWMEMLVWRSQSNSMQNTFSTLLVRWETAAKCTTGTSLQQRWSQRTMSVTWRLFTLWKNSTSIHGKNRKYWNLLLKLHDLVMLSLMLRDQLEAGTPERITYAFATMAALNALSCATGILLPRFTALVEVLVDSLFDFAATVLYPLAVLYYCSTNFHYDRAVYYISLELLPVGSFERRARMYANPAEMALVRATFDSIRILDSTDFCLRIAMNLAFSYRFKRIVDVLIQLKMGPKRAQDRRKTSMKPSPVQLSFTNSTTDMNWQRQVPKPVAAVFVAYALGVLVTTYKAISTSQAACATFSQCVVFAYRWRDTEYCPCLALVDGNPAPKTYYEWTHPVDASETVAALAMAGTLQTLQLVNRQLLALPNELRGCSSLNFISLINCATETLPVWTNEFRSLQYLQIEGKQGSNNLGNLDSQLFNDMPQLRYLQLGVHSRMAKLPSLEGAPNLRSIILSRLYNLVELPPLTRQTRLERLELTTARSLPALPDLQPVVPLLNFTIFQGAYLCCNGFRGDCDLTNPYCKSTTCLGNASARATPATLQAMKDFAFTVCQPYSTPSQVPTPETIQMCDGVPYKQCFIPVGSNSTLMGMCYNHRMQVLACNPDPDKIRVRRRQIQDRVGAPCDPNVEAWLGCSRYKGSDAR